MCPVDENTLPTLRGAFCENLTMLRELNIRKKHVVYDIVLQKKLEVLMSVIQNVEWNRSVL